MSLRTSHPLRALLSALALAVVAGCGPSVTPAPTGSTPGPVDSAAPTNGNTGAFDVCGLLTGGDLERAYGQKMKVAQSLPPGSWAAGSCTWEGTDASKPASLNVMVGTGASMADAGISNPSDWVTSTADAAAQIYGGDATAVSGLGDQAFQASNATSGQLIFCRRSTCALVVVIGLGKEATVALGKAIANGL